MMIPVPAIDLLDGCCVRLLQGAYDQVTSYHRDPLIIARRWESMGAPLLHVVDLDAARSGGKTNNSGIIAELSKKISIPIQTGGGIRSEEDVTRVLEQGIHRVIIGTAAVQNPEMVRMMIKKYGPERVAVGIDAREGEVRVRGWTDQTGKSALEFAKEMEQHGVHRIIYTDIARDGTMDGPNLGAYQELGHQLNFVKLMASGGVSGPEDLAALSNLESAGVDSVIIGRALYEGKFAGHDLWPEERTRCP